MKHLLPILLLAVAFYARSQYKPISFEADLPIYLSQIDNRENSTLVFIDYTAPKSRSWGREGHLINVSDDTYISIPGSSKKFRLLSTINIPIDDDAEQKFMTFDRSKQNHHFILEFEKIPNECSQFDIVENQFESSTFNISNITINRSDSMPQIDINRFVEGYPIKEYGKYYVNGKLVSYIKHNDLIITTFPDITNQYGKYVTIHVCIQNFRDKAILFNPLNLSARSLQYAAKKQESNFETKRHSKSGLDKSKLIPYNIDVLTYEEYDKIIKRKQRWESFWAALGEGLSAAAAGFSSSVTNYSTGSYSTTYGRSRTMSYNGFASYTAGQIAEEKIVQLNESQHQIRDHIRDNYMRMHTIPSQTEYSGFFNIKYDKKMNGVSYTITINGEDYTFYY